MLRRAREVKEEKCCKPDSGHYIRKKHSIAYWSKE